MTTVCHNKKKIEKKLKIIVFVDYICYNDYMKKYISILLIAITFLMLTTCNVGILFANGDTDEPAMLENLQTIDIEVENLDEYIFLDNYSTEILLTSNSKIAKFDVNTPDEVEYQVCTMQTGIFEPKFATKIGKNNIAVFDGLKRVQIFDEEFNFVKSINVVYVNEDSAYNLENVTSIAKDFFGQIYMLDLFHQKLLTLNVSNQ